MEASLQYPSNIFCQLDANPIDNVAIYWQTPTNIVLSKEGKIVRSTSIKNLNNKHNLNLDEFDLENDFEIDNYNEKERIEALVVNNNTNNNQLRTRLNRLTIVSKGVRSKLTIVPNSIDDFGLYKCWAENAIGSNKYEPCLFNLTNSAVADANVIDAAVAGATSILALPKPVNNCVTNYSNGQLSVRCRFDQTWLVEFGSNSSSDLTSSSSPSSQLSSSSLMQSKSMLEKNLLFHLEVYEINSTSLVVVNLLFNQTNTLEPTFIISGLHRNSIYQIIVYTSNHFGVSDKVSKINFKLIWNFFLYIS